MHRQDGLTVAVVAELNALMAGSGRAESAYDLRWMPASEKARVALARLHEANVPGVRLLEIALSISARIADRGPSDPEFRNVQIAKSIHRLASGTHKTTSGLRLPSKYPHSSGQVLRIVGRRVQDVAAIVANDDAINEVIYLARPAIDKFEQAGAKRVAAEDLVAREMMRVRSFFEGPQSSERLAKYEQQQRRLHGLK